MQEYLSECDISNKIDTATRYWLSVLSDYQCGNHTSSEFKAVVKTAQEIIRKGVGNCSPEKKLDFCIEAASTFADWVQEISDENTVLLSEEEKSFIGEVCTVS